MRQKSGPVKESAEKVVKDIRRATRRQFSAEEKIRIVLEGLRGEESIAELCRREGWFYLSTILDDFSRYIIAWKLCTTMKVEDVTATLDLALKASGLDQAKVIHRPRLLSDNGSSYIAADLAKWLDGQNMEHVRGAPYHPMTQGKIERWHQTLKNRILLENYYLPGDLEAQIEAFVVDYNRL